LRVSLVIPSALLHVLTFILQGPLKYIVSSTGLQMLLVETPLQKFQHGALDSTSRNSARVWLGHGYGSTGARDSSCYKN